MLPFLPRQLGSLKSNVKSPGSSVYLLFGKLFHPLSVTQLFSFIALCLIVVPRGPFVQRREFRNL